MSGDTINHPRPLCAGYLRRLDGVDEPVEQRLIADMCALAEREGFTLTLVFIEKRPARTAALDAVTRYCQRHGIHDVVVPSRDHLNTLPSLAYLAEELLHQDIGGQVWIVAPTEEEESSCPLTIENGGTT
ncbi:hypothetical protein [Streptomyces sp. NPDC048341]|uniref:hypothetical protein n=1 Tax=Streptomyces sp. NPDC048341 TaxID=3154620 RepID=UPI00343EAA70